MKMSIFNMQSKYINHMTINSMNISSMSINNINLARLLNQIKVVKVPCLSPMQAERVSF